MNTQDCLSKKLGTDDPTVDGKFPDFASLVFHLIYKKEGQRIPYSASYDFFPEKLVLQQHRIVPLSCETRLT